MPFIKIEGCQLYWNQVGCGPPILLIMGLSFTHEMWFRVFPALKDSYRAIFFDNRGMGRSGVPPGPYSIPQMARDAVAVLDAAGLPAAHIVGASMGGMIAQELALRYPTRVLSLMLACTSHGGFLARWPKFRHAPVGSKWLRANRADRERSLRQLLYAEGTSLERIEEDLRVRCGCAWTYRGFLNQFIGILRWTSYRRLPRIRIPTMVIHGEEDRLIPIRNGKVLAARIPGARFHPIPHAGHILMTDQPEASTGAMLAFLAEQSVNQL